MGTIARKDIIIFEDAELRIVLPSNSISKGHAIIETKEKYNTIEKLPESLLRKSMQLVQVYVRVFKKLYSPKGYSLMQNEGQFNKSEDFKLHIIPRFSKKEFSWTYSDVEISHAFEFSRIKMRLQEQLKKKMDTDS